MKIIVSHDIDHWRWRDHWFRDLYIPKYVARSILASVQGMISPSVLWRRIAALRHEYQHRLDDLILFNRSMGVEATFFVAVAPGRSLSYAPHATPEIVEWLRTRGCNHIGLHGIAHDDLDVIRFERDCMSDLLGRDDFGIRMHYLRKSGETLKMLAKAGYLYSSTTNHIGERKLIGNMVEFPIGIMDVDAVTDGIVDADQAVENTLRVVDKAEQYGITHFVINFHDVYFDDAWPVQKTWYQELLVALVDYGKEFTTFEMALQGAPPRIDERLVL